VKLRRPACSLAALSLLVAARAASADAVPPIVRVYVAGAPEAVAGSRDAIQDLCSRSNVAIVVRDAAGADEALLATEPAPGLAEAYVDLRAGTPTRVVVVDGETHQDLERRTLPAGASLEISIETVARVLCSAVESSLAMRATASAHAAVVPAQLNAVPAPPRARPRRLDGEADWAPKMGIFGAVENFGAGFQGGAGAALSVTHGRSRLRAGALVTVAGYSSAEVEAASASASFGLIGVRLLPMLDWRVTSGVSAFAGAGGGGDWTRVTAERAPQGGEPNDVGSTLDPIASAMLGARLAISGNLEALFALDADLDITRHRYVIEAPEGSRSFFEPARLRSMALAGLSLSFGSATADGSTSPVEDRR
jgi:hypothetical protein